MAIRNLQQIYLESIEHGYKDVNSFGCQHMLGWLSGRLQNWKVRGPEI